MHRKNKNLDTARKFIAVFLFSIPFHSVGFEKADYYRDV